MKHKTLLRAIGMIAAFVSCQIGATMETTATAAGATPKQENPAGTVLWLESSLKRVYPQSPPGTSRTIEMATARNRHASFQACVRNERPSQLSIECEVSGGDGVKVQVRRVGYVPLRHMTVGTEKAELEGTQYAPGLVPDPLFNESKAAVGPFENQSFWITLTVPADAKPGVRDLKIKYWLDDKKQSAELSARLDVKPLVIKPLKDFPIVHWWRPEDIYDWYKVEPWSDKWYELSRAYLKNMLEHYSDVVFVPAIYPRREHISRPAQMLKVKETAPNQFDFDFSEIRKFVRFAKEIGFKKFEWPHLWIYWGVKNPMRVYEWKDGKPVELWPPDADGFGERYTAFLRQYLPKLKEFCEAEGILETSYFHISDEPGGDEHFARYQKARQVLRELAPWMKVMDALSEVRYGKTGVTDYPIPIVHEAHHYVDAKIPHWVYYCCAPQGPWLNRFFDTPLAKIRMSGWLFHRFKAQGFLHWGYNYWRVIEKEPLIDPFNEGASAAWPGIPYGDPFVVYPGADGPLDSIRWEVFAESIEDQAMLQTLGVSADDPVLAPLKSYADFPKTAEWVTGMAERLAGGE